jgi:hypothetical protein
MEEQTLLDDIREYSLKELHQLESMTQQVLDHWHSMIRPDLKEGVKKAIELSIEIAENDLKLIRAQKEIKIAQPKSQIQQSHTSANHSHHESESNAE